MDQKVAIITGASSGIGKACALELAREGYNIAIAARNIDKLNLTKQACEEIGVKAISVKCDVSVEDDCKKLIAETINAFGSINILVNNAGISMRAVFNDLDLEVLKQSMDINFWGMV